MDVQGSIGYSVVVQSIKDVEGVVNLLVYLPLTL